jgi:uncharacterized protein involved in exopolysaccharide biosynthesis
MVLKFRDESLKRLERSIKSGTVLCSEESQQVLNSLRNEVIALEAYSEYHPEVARVQSENKSLREELDKLKSSNSSIRELTAQKAKELTEIFEQLSSESDQGEVNIQTLR